MPTLGFLSFQAQHLIWIWTWQLRLIGQVKLLMVDDVVLFKLLVHIILGGSDTDTFGSMKRGYSLLEPGQSRPFCPETVNLESPEHNDITEQLWKTQPKVISKTLT